MLFYGSFSLSFKLLSFHLEKQTWKTGFLYCVRGGPTQRGMPPSSIPILIFDFLFELVVHKVLRTQHFTHTKTHFCQTPIRLQHQRACVRVAGFPADTPDIWTRLMAVAYACGAQAERCVALRYINIALRRCHQPSDVKLDDSEPLQQTNLLKWQESRAALGSG